MRGNAGIDEMIRRLRLAKGMVRHAAADAAKAFEAQLKAQLAAGRAPDGSAWKPTKAGTRPLQRAAGAVTVKAVGTALLVRLTGHHVFHHYGTAKDPQRRILPFRGLPDSLGEAIKSGLVRWWERNVAG